MFLIITIGTNNRSYCIPVSNYLQSLASQANSNQNMEPINIFAVILPSLNYSSKAEKIQATENESISFNAPTFKSNETSTKISPNKPLESSNKSRKSSSSKNKKINIAAFMCTNNSITDNKLLLLPSLSAVSEE